MEARKPAYSELGHIEDRAGHLAHQMDKLLPALDLPDCYLAPWESSVVFRN